MPLLKFRVSYEDDDAIFRDIEIKPAQGFADFETIIISSYSLIENNAGLFFLSNDNWQKGGQIYPVVKKAEKKTGTRAKAEVLPSIVTFIDDPHQHFLYEFHGSQPVLFLIELISIGGAVQEDNIYPLVVRMQGASPFKKEIPHQHIAKNKNVAPKNIIDDSEDDEEDEDPEAAFLENDTVADPEDLAAIEGEEGDLMEGDSIKEDGDDDTGNDNYDADDDFDAEELGEEPTAADFDEEL